VWTVNEVLVDIYPFIIMVDIYMADMYLLPTLSLYKRLRIYRPK
jgi:hypothetical protein